MSKEKKNTKLNEIKADLEIKLVKLELQKIKLQESQLQEDIKKEVLNTVIIDNKVLQKDLNENKESNKKKKEKEKEKKATVIVGNSEDKEEKKKSNKLIFYILGVLFLLGIIYLTVKYINNLKSEIQSKEQLLIDKKEKENINFDSNEYFKDVEDEVTDEELQDFTNYKDVPEIVVNNSNKSNSKEVKVSKVINDQINKANNTKVKPIINNNNEINDEELINSKNLDSINNSQKIETINSNQNTETIIAKVKTDLLQKNKNLVIENEEVKITSDFIKVIALQYKDKKYKIPKKAKKTNSFSIRVRLNKFKEMDANNKVKIMLVIKNTVGKTLKIDIKEVDFTKIKTTYITFYETFSNNLEVNEEYSFSILANDKLIKNITKRI